MTAFTSTLRSGIPTSGRFATSDTYTDKDGVQFQCIRGGYPGVWQLVGPVVIKGKTSSEVGAVNGTGVSVVEYGAGGGVHQSVFTITAMPLTISNASAPAQASGLKIYTFPEGRILILGATGSIAETTTSAIAGTLTAGKTCKFGVGTTVGVSATLATTEQDIVPVTSITSSATINVAGAVANAALAASAQFDGTAAAKTAFLNFSVPTDLDLAGDATITLTGTVIINWMLLGDY